MCPMKPGTHLRRGDSYRDEALEERCHLGRQVIALPGLQLATHFADTAKAAHLTECVSMDELSQAPRTRSCPSNSCVNIYTYKHSHAEKHTP
jgi:hypothetical protein